jgi:hypothetical protein
MIEPKLATTEDTEDRRKNPLADGFILGVLCVLRGGELNTQ